MAGRSSGPRVIAGSARGIELRAPRSGRTRPTTSRLRESLFAMLEAADISFEHVLDLYAGSGALGIEALSRGDGEATFVEADAKAAALIRENLRRTQLEGRGHVVVAKVGRWRPPAGEHYTLVLADPPYERAEERAPNEDLSYHGAAPAQLGVREESGPWAAVEATVRDALAAGAAVVIERDGRRAAPSQLGALPLWRDRRQGAGAVAIYRDHEDARQQDGHDVLDREAGPEDSAHSEGNDG